MKRYRGFKLGRRLVRVWRWVVHRRSGRYLRLDTATEYSISKRNLPSTCKTKTTRLFNWGHHFSRRLCRGPHGSPREFGSEAPLLDGEGRRGWKTRPPPKGHLPVYVGGESLPRRYVVPVVYFNHPLLKELLREAEEEFGFHHPGGITIPCAATEFERVRMRITDAGKRLHRRSLSPGSSFSIWFPNRGGGRRFRRGSRAKTRGSEVSATGSTGGGGERVVAAAMALTGMRGLSVFISDVRNCQNKEQERLRVDKELGNIRTRFKNEKVVYSLPLSS
ncbi:hypothetical protein BHE74_00049643 [Ensete ventricosum]|nr:hypothetical protein BHE74_00049643 [Ensete ventricosum]